MSRAIKVISPKTVIGSTKAILKRMRDGDKIHLYRVLGVVNSYVEGESQYGKWVKFSGDFECSNEEIAGTTIMPKKSIVKKCFFPEPYSQMVVDAVDANGDGPTPSIGVSVDIGIEKLKTDRDGTVTSEYTVHTLTDFVPPPNDVLQKMINQFSEVVPEITVENRLLVEDRTLPYVELEGELGEPPPY